MAVDLDELERRWQAGECLGAASIDAVFAERRALIAEVRALRQMRVDYQNLLDDLRNHEEQGPG